MGRRDSSARADRIILGRHAQEQVAAGEAEDEVRGPCREHGRQLVGVAHGFEESGRHPVDDGDAERNGDSGQCATTAAPRRKRNGQHRHHQRGQRESNFLLQLHFEAYGVESALLQILNVISQLLVIHFGGLPHFFLEIAGIFTELGESRDVKGAVLLNGGSLERAHPAVLEDPLLDAWLPMRAVGVNSPGQLEGGGVELEDGNSAEAVHVGIEDLVIVNLVVLAEDPFAVGLQISLWGFALDLIAQNFLLFVGMRYVDLIEDKQAASEDGGENNDRKSCAVDADTGGLHGRQLAGFLHQAKGDQHREQDRHGSHQVDERWREVQQILDEQDERNFVADDVGQQLKEREDQREEKKGGKDHRQIHGEVAQNHVVQNQREPGAVALARLASPRTSPPAVARAG